MSHAEESAAEADDGGGTAPRLLSELWAEILRRLLAAFLYPHPGHRHSLGHLPTCVEVRPYDDYYLSIDL